LFQSHYGSIKTNFFKLAYSCYNCFNPTMVRLKHLYKNRVFAIQYRFNPTMVRLKQKLTKEKMTCQKSFNPTMVRLKHQSRPFLLFRISLFQSHYGSIKTPYYFINPGRFY